MTGKNNPETPSSTSADAQDHLVTRYRYEQLREPYKSYADHVTALMLKCSDILSVATPAERASLLAQAKKWAGIAPSVEEFNGLTGPAKDLARAMGFGTTVDVGTGIVSVINTGGKILGTTIDASKIPTDITVGATSAIGDIFNEGIIRKLSPQQASEIGASYGSVLQARAETRGGMFTSADNAMAYAGAGFATAWDFVRGTVIGQWLAMIPVVGPFLNDMLNKDAEKPRSFDQHLQRAFFNADMKEVASEMREVPEIGGIPTRILAPYLTQGGTSQNAQGQDTDVNAPTADNPYPTAAAPAAAAAVDDAVDSIGDNGVPVVPTEPKLGFFEGIAQTWNNTGEAMQHAGENFGQTIENSFGKLGSPAENPMGWGITGVVGIQATRGILEGFVRPWFGEKSNPVKRAEKLVERSDDLHIRAQAARDGKPGLRIWERGEKAAAALEAEAAKISSKVQTAVQAAEGRGPGNGLFGHFTEQAGKNWGNWGKNLESGWLRHPANLMGNVVEAPRNIMRFFSTTASGAVENLTHVSDNVARGTASQFNQISQQIEAGLTEGSAKAAEGRIKPLEKATKGAADKASNLAKASQGEGLFGWLSTNKSRTTAMEKVGKAEENLLSRATELAARRETATGLRTTAGEAAEALTHKPTIFNNVSRAIGGIGEHMRDGIAGAQHMVEKLSAGGNAAKVAKAVDTAEDVARIGGKVAPKLLAGARKLPVVGKIIALLTVGTTAAAANAAYAQDDATKGNLVIADAASPIPLALTDFLKMHREMDATAKVTQDQLAPVSDLVPANKNLMLSDEVPDRSILMTIARLKEMWTRNVKEVTLKNQGSGITPLNDFDVGLSIVNEGGKMGFVGDDIGSGMDETTYTIPEAIAANTRLYIARGGSPEKVRAALGMAPAATNLAGNDGKNALQGGTGTDQLDTGLALAALGQTQKAKKASAHTEAANAAKPMVARSVQVGAVRHDESDGKRGFTFEMPKLTTPSLAKMDISKGDWNPFA